VRPARSTSPYRSPQARSCCRRPTLAILEASKALAGGQKNPGVALRAVGRSLVKPIVLAPLACVVFSLLGVPLAEAVSRSFQSIGEAAGGVALFVTGLILSAQRIELGPSVLSGALLKNVLHPLSVFGLILALPMDRDTARAALLLCALPSGFLFGLRYGLNSRPRIASCARAASRMPLPTLSKKMSIPLAHRSFSRA
jgi:malonate transporter and related proteins